MTDVTKFYYYVEFISLKKEERSNGNEFYTV